MTETASTLSTDPAPISSSSNFYMAALNQRKEEKKKGGVILSMEIATLKEALENGLPPSVVSLETGASKVLQQWMLMIPWHLERGGARASTLLQTTHPM